MDNDKRDPQLDEGFEEVPVDSGPALDAGFEPVDTGEVTFVPMGLNLDASGMPVETGPTRGEAFIEGAKEGGTFGFSGEMGGGIGAGLETLAGPPGEPGESKIDQFSRLYDEYKRANEAKTKAAMEAHPGTFMTGSLAGGMAIPIPPLYKLGQVAPELKAGTQLLPEAAESLMTAPNTLKTVLKTPALTQKMLAGAKVGAPAGALAGIGTSEASIGEPGQLVEDALSGAAGGTLVGTALPAAWEGAVATGKVLKAGAKGIGGMIQKPISLGYKYGLKGQPAIGEEAGEQVGKEITAFGKQLPKEYQTLVNKIATERRNIIDMAEKAGVKVDPQKVDDYLSQFLDPKYMTNDTAFEREINQFKEMFKTAKEGKLVKKTKEVFLPEEGNTQLGTFMKKYEQLKQNPPDIKAQLSDRERIIRKFERIKAEQRAVPGQHSPVEPELVFEPSDIPGVEFGIIRQPQFDDMGNFSGYKRLATQEIRKTKAVSVGEPEMIVGDAPTDDPNLKTMIIRQPELDEAGQVVGYRTLDEQMIPQDEMAKSRMITSLEREGGRDLTNPSELFQLYNELKNKQFSTPQVQKTAEKAAKEGQAIFREAVPGSEELDKMISQVKSSSEALGLDTKDVDMKTDMKILTTLIHQLRAKGATGATARQNLKDAVQQLEGINPALAQKIREKTGEFSERVDLAYGPKAYLPRLLATPTAALRWVGYGTGRSVYEIQKNDPYYLSTLAQKIGSIQNSKSAQYVGQELQKAAQLTKERDRNAILFGILQNPAYRQLIQETMDQESAGVK